MTINCSPKQQEIFNAFREVLPIIDQKKENGSTTNGQPLSHFEALDYLFFNSPVYEKVKKYMEIKEAKKIEFLKEVSK